MATYPEEFKKSIVEKILSDKNISLRYIAKKNGVPFSTVRVWIKKYGHVKTPMIYPGNHLQIGH